EHVLDGPLLEHHAFDGIVGQAVAPAWAAAQSVGEMSDAVGVHAVVAKLAPKGPHQQGRPIRGFEMKHVASGLHFGLYVAILANENLPRSGAAPGNDKRRASTLCHLGHLASNLHGQGIREGHAGAFRQTPDLLDKMGTMSIEEWKKTEGTLLQRSAV